MTKKGEIIPAQSELWTHDPKFQPVDLDVINREYELGMLHMKAEALVGEKFTIFSMKRIQSDLDGIGYYYFCECADLEGKEIFTTSLGGQVLVELLDKVMEKSVKEPFTVELDFVKSGQYGGYYIFR